MTVTGLKTIVYERVKVPGSIKDAIVVKQMH